MSTTAPHRPRRLPSRRLAAATAVVAFLVSGVVLHQAWWTQPTAFGGWGNRWQSNPVGAPYETMNVTVSDAYSDGETISVRSLEPVIVQNSADATFDFVICSQREDNFRVGFSWGSLGEYCTATTPAEGREFKVDSDSEYIVMRMTPRKAGITEVNGAKMTYRRGWKHLWQTGTEQIGPEAQITMR